MTTPPSSVASRPSTTSATDRRSLGSKLARPVRALGGGGGGGGRRSLDAFAAASTSNGSKGGGPPSFGFGGGGGGGRSPSYTSAVAGLSCNRSPTAVALLLSKMASPLNASALSGAAS